MNYCTLKKRFHTHPAPNIKVMSTRKEKRVVKEHKFGQMDVYMRVNGRMVGQMGKEKLNILMVQHMKGILRTTKQTVKAY